MTVEPPPIVIKPIIQNEGKRESPPEKRPFSSLLPPHVWIVCALVSAAIILWARLEGSIVSYVGWIGLVVSVRGFIADRFPHAIWIAAPILLITFLLFAYTDYYDYRWESERRQNVIDVIRNLDKKQAKKDYELYIDTHHRWSGTKVNQRTIYHQGDKIVGSTNGPLARSGARHGKWIFWFPPLEQETQYYWYGDKVSEGDWHLHNR